MDSVNLFNCLKQENLQRMVANQEDRAEPPHLAASESDSKMDQEQQEKQQALTERVDELQGTQPSINSVFRTPDDQSVQTTSIHRSKVTLPSSNRIKKYAVDNQWKIWIAIKWAFLGLY